MDKENFIQRIFPFIQAQCIPFAIVSFLPTMSAFSLSFLTATSCSIAIIISQCNEMYMNTENMKYEMMNDVICENRDDIDTIIMMIYACETK